MIQQQNMSPIYHEGLASRNNHKLTFIFCTLIFIGNSMTCVGQQNGFPYGAVTIAELTATVYPIDTSASAIVLNEFGEAYINGNDFNLYFEYHVKIKILKKEGLEKANFEIALHKNGRNEDFLREIEAVTFTFENNQIVEKKLDRKAIFTEDVNEYWTVKKFTLPNVQVGSVIEVRYSKVSPFITNFQPWEFQSDIPKLQSEYWARIPGIYVYNISLKGYQSLSKSESTLEKECLIKGSAKADCSFNKYAMKNIPAFIEEDYSTASSNFIAAIQFELKEIHFFDGRVDKITKEWKDVDDEVRRDTRFGVQLKKGKDIATEIEKLIDPTGDDLTKAKAVFDFIKSWYRWNGVYGMYSEFGIKKAFDTKTGNVGDINLSLIAALRFAGLEVDPVLLSTRANGIVTDLYPVLSDFNYVIARFETAGKIYLLDATDDFMPFGLVPERCLNGNGRVLADKKSYWMDVLPMDKRKELSLINLKLEEDGYLRGTIQNVFTGYEAAAQRKKVFGFPSVEEYFKDLDSQWSHIEILKSELENFDDLDQGLIETLDVEIDASNNSAQKVFFFNPFLIQKWEQNPFKSNARLYPVDFGYPYEWKIIVALEIPESMQLEEIPNAISLALPQNGGSYRLQVSETGNRITVQSTLAINRTIFSSYEYPSLKELFSRVIQAQNSDLVFISK